MKDGRTQLNRMTQRRSRLVSAVITLLVTAALLALVFGVWLLGIRVDDSGMAPTISRGDIIFFDRLSRFVRVPERGDIIAYSTADGIKLGRIVGMPGEAVDTDGGKLYLNGVLLDERLYSEFVNPDMDNTVLGRNEYFIMPDARAAMDPEPAHMVIPIESFVGRALIRVAPISRFGVFE